MRLFGYCGVIASCEVSGLFQHLVPQEALNSVEVQQARQVMIPVFGLKLPVTAAPGLATPGLIIKFLVR